LMLYMFKALGVICDEYFVPSLEVIVEKLQLSNDVAGATFMAAGSSAPELFTSLVATFLIVNEGGVGTIVGSAIFNILVIVGATGVIACKDQSLKIWWYPLSRDCFFYSLSILELMIILSNEQVEWYEALIMFFTYVLYCVYMKFNPKIVELLGLQDPSVETTVTTVEVTGAEETQIKVIEPAKEAAPASTASTTNGTATETEKTALRAAGESEAAQDTKPPEVEGPGTVNTEKANGEKTDEKQETHLTVKAEGGLQAPTASPREKRRPSWSMTEVKKQEEEQRRPSKEGQPLDPENNPEDRPAPLCEGPPEEEGPKGIWKFLRDPLVVFWELTMPAPEKFGGGLLFSLSILFIGLCTYLMVDSTNRVGVILHIPPLAMALVFLAAGTSIPDALGSIAVAKQGEGDMAVANALGSNVFDILIGLGVPWFIKTALMGKEVVFTGKWVELRYDIGVLVFVLFLFVGCLIAHKWHLTRRVGILLLLMYVGFLIYNIFAVWVIDPPLKEQEEQGHCDTL